MDLSKTQFLVEDHMTHTTIKPFRRRRVSMLFNKEGKPLREMSWAEWLEFKAERPIEIAQDGLALHVVWKLVPVST